MNNQNSQIYEIKKLNNEIIGQKEEYQKLKKENISNIIIIIITGSMLIFIMAIMLWFLSAMYYTFLLKKSCGGGTQSLNSIMLHDNGME